MRVLVIHCTEKGRLPKLTPEQGEALKENLTKALEENPEVEYKGTWLNPDGIGICDFEAPNTEVIESIVKEKLKAPYDAVVAVEQLEL